MNDDPSRAYQIIYDPFISRDEKRRMLQGLLPDGEAQGYLNSLGRADMFGSPQATSDFEHLKELINEFLAEPDEPEIPDDAELDERGAPIDPEPDPDD